MKGDLSSFSTAESFSQFWPAKQMNERIHIRTYKSSIGNAKGSVRVAIPSPIPLLICYHNHLDHHLLAIRYRKNRTENKIRGNVETIVDG